MKNEKTLKRYSRKQFMKNAGGALIGGGLLTTFGIPAFGKEHILDAQSNVGYKKRLQLPAVKRVAADPFKLPAPIKRKTPKTVEIHLEAIEKVGEIESGVQFHYMTFGGQVPSPMIRVRRGDTIILTLSSAEENIMLHNIDLHAVYGTGGGAEATFVTPGSSQTIKFKAMYPGAFVYHCAVPQMDQHISSGMFGMILVEPEEGLPAVDHEFYIGQNEIYIEGNAGEPGLKQFDFEKMKREEPDYVLMNGEVGAVTEDGYGAVKVNKGDTARLFFVNGGPNLTSSVHPIGNVFTKAWRDGAIMSQPERFVQTMQVAPGSCGVFEMEFPVPSTVHLVDHALTRVESKGNGADIVVEGAPDTNIYDPNFE